uniref:Putative secreted protein n=1 Tax=Anopheles darlingi TaxID=43151 RepID=A0A2M4D137_ANODA
MIVMLATTAMTICLMAALRVSSVRTILLLAVLEGDCSFSATSISSASFPLILSTQPLFVPSSTLCADRLLTSSSSTCCDGVEQWETPRK